MKNLLAYVFTIARNEANRLIERLGRERSRLMEMENEALIDQETSGERDREPAEIVAHLLEKLDPPLREIVELKTFGALTFREISEVTGLPQGTVATRYRAALERMRSQVVKEWQ